MGQASAAAFEDAAGTRAVVVDARFAWEFNRAEAVAARVMREYGLERGAILLHGTSSGAPDREEDVFEAIGAAIADLSPATLHWASGSLWVGSARGRITEDGSIISGGRTPEVTTPVYGPIRSAFQLVDLSENGLKRRDDPTRAAPLQAISLGRQAAILALPGNAPIANYSERGLIVLPFCSSAAAFPDNARYAEAIRRIMARVGR